MGIQLGSFMDGYEETGRYLDSRAASKGVSDARKIQNELDQRRLDSEKASDSYLNAATKSSNSAAASGVDGPGVPVASGSAASRPQGTAQDESSFDGVNPTGSNAEAVRSYGVNSGSVAARDLSDQAPPPPAPAPAPMAQPAAADSSTPTAPTAPPPTAPMASMGVQPQADIPNPGQASSSPLVQAVTTGQAPGARAPAPAPDPLANYKTAIDNALRDGNGKAAESLRRRYTAELANSLETANLEFKKKIQPLLEGENHDQVVHAVMTGPAARSQAALGSALLALQTDPDSDATKSLVKNVFHNDQIAGIRYAPDKESGQIMAVMVDKKGKPIMDQSGQPVARPADLVRKLAMSAPGGQVLAPQMVDTKVTSLGDGSAAVYNGQHPLGTAPSVNVVGAAPGGLRDERIASLREKAVAPALKTLDTRMRQPPGPMQSIGAVKPEYSDLYESAQALAEKMALQSSQSGQSQVQPQAIASSIGKLLDRVLAMRKTSPKYSLEDAMRDSGTQPGAAPAAPTQGGTPPTAADVQSKFGF
jgi:hypothetical protein